MSVSSIMHKVSPIAFLAGVGLTAVIYAGVAAALLIGNHDDTLKRLENSMASQSVPIQRDIFTQDQSSSSLMQNDTHTEIHDTEIHDSGPSHTLNNSDVNQKNGPVTNVETEEVRNETHIEPTPAPTLEPQQPVDKKIPSYNTLSERIDGYTIPVKPSVNLPSVFEAYRKTYTPPAIMTGNVYAMVFYDFGLSEKLTKDLLPDMPHDITLALSPYSTSPSSMRTYLGENEYESWIMLPMETSRFPAKDPGPKALLTRSSYDNNRDNLYWTLSRAQGYAGIVGYSDNAFAQTKPAFGALVKEIYDRGLAYVDLNSDGNTQISVIASRYPERYGQTNLNFEKYSKGYSGDDFTQLATAIVENRPYAILSFPMSGQAIGVAKQVQKLLQEQGHHLAPLSYILDQTPKESIDLEINEGLHAGTDHSHNNHGQENNEHGHAQHH